MHPGEASKETNSKPCADLKRLLGILPNDAFPAHVMAIRHSGHVEEKESIYLPSAVKGDTTKGKETRKCCMVQLHNRTKGVQRRSHVSQTTRDWEGDSVQRGRHPQRPGGIKGMAGAGRRQRP